MPSPTGTEHLTKDQRRAVTLPPGPLMILAGAGTGKTTTILHRVLVQVKRGNFSPRHTVILTFTDKATRDLSNKLVQLDPVIGDQVTIQTFHGFCYALVAELEPELHRRLTLIEEGEQIYLLARHIPEMTFLTSRAFREDPLSALQARCIPFFNRVRDELLSVDDLQSLWQQIDPDTFDPAHWLPTLSPRIEREEAWNQLQDLVQLYTRYQDWKREEGVLDYGDMIMECWSLLRRDPVRLSRVRDLYRHFIVDEYQDNNVALNEILKLLVPPRNDITVVGDQDQCIYSFRGANYQTIRDFQDTFLQGNRERLVLLEANFRSTQEILNLANQLMRQDPHRVEKNLYSGTDKTGRRPVWIPWSSRQFEDRLPSLLQQVRQEGYDWADMAILVRGGDQVRRVTRILRGAGIPADSFVEQFFQVPVIRDLVAWCEVLTDGPRFGPALGRVVSRYDGEAAPDGFWKQMTTLDALHRGLGDLADWFPEFVDHFRELEERLHKHLTPREMLWSILEITDLLGPARRRYDALDRLNLINAGHLIAMADQFSTRLDQVTFRDWGLFLSTLAVQSNRPAQEPERMNHGSAVQVMTIHRSKGLQFPVVVLPYLVANSFPRNFTPDPGVQCLPEPWYRWPRQEGVTPRDEHLNEERRVFYVGITRAMETLYLIGPRQRGSKLLKPILEQQPDLVQVQSDIMASNPSPPTETLPGELVDRVQSALKQGDVTAVRHLLDEWERTRAISGKPAEPDQQELFLSATKIETYLTCPLKYRLQFIDQFPEKKSQARMGFGTIIHRVLEQFHSPGSELTEERILTLLDQAWDSRYFEYRIREEEFRRQAETYLKSYVQWVAVNPPSRPRPEVKVTFALPDINVKITGKIDRIDQDEEGLRIVDYKTGNPSREPLKKNFQLALYTAAIRRGAIPDLPADQPIRVQLIFVKDLAASEDEYRFSPTELAEQLDRVTQTAAGIRQGNFQPKPSRHHCSYCDYKDFLCPEFESDGS